MLEIPSIDDDRVKITIGPITLKSGESFTLKVPRLDFLDPDEHESMIEELNALDVESQIIAVANDLAESPIKTESVWEPVLKPARLKLIELGVKWERISVEGRNRDKFTVPSQKVLDALEPYSSQEVQSLPKRNRAVALTVLKHILTPAELEKCSQLAIGQLNAIRDEWQKQSNITLGEFLASESS